MAKLIKWRVSEKATGSYASFQFRPWPKAYVGDEIVVQIVSSRQGLGNTEGYDPHSAKTGDHSPLRVMVRWPNSEFDPNGAWTWRYLRGEFKTLTEAKEQAEGFWNRCAGQLPKKEKP